MSKFSFKLNFNKENLLKIIKENQKKAKTMAIILFIVFAFFAFVMNDDTDNNTEISDMESQYQIKNDEVINNYDKLEQTEIYIDVAGAVKNPGVVLLPSGSRVFQAIEAAGGVDTSADTININLASELNDGDKIYVPFKDENLNYSGYEQFNNSKEGKININTADLLTLTQLSGVGVVTAENIISYREQNGKFKKIEDIKNVSGIGDKTFEKFKEQICV